MKPILNQCCPDVALFSKVWLFWRCMARMRTRGCMQIQANVVGTPNQRNSDDSVAKFSLKYETKTDEIKSQY